MSGAADVDVRRAETERRLVRRGVPHLIEDDNASENIWTGR